jgi:uncharacterized protein YndB with AHSA1/START domain
MIKHLKKVYTIHSPVARVWDALTNPDMIRKYFFGTEARSNWRPGSTILYRGIWEGKRYEDKGIIEEIIPERKLTINHWSSRTGTPDLPENYSPHTYSLTPSGDTTKITLSQEDHTENDEQRSKAWRHWDIVMEELDKLLQKPNPVRTAPPLSFERAARQRH